MYCLFGKIAKRYWKNQMETKTTKRCEANAAIMKALSHPTRLFILEQIASQEQCVYDLAKMVGHDISTISKHLSILKNTGIVAREKRGSQVFYTLRIPCVLEFLACAEKVIQSHAREMASAATSQ